MRWPVTFLGLGTGALDLVPVRARARLGAAELVVSDEAARLAHWAPQAERVEARALNAAEVVVRLRAAYEAGRPCVRAIAGTLGASVRALDEIRPLLEAGVSVEVLGAAPGDTVRWPWRERLPLAGKRIAVTRPRAADDELADLLGRFGAEVLEAPALEVLPPEDFGPLDRAIEGLHRYACLVLTSANGAEAFVQRLLERGKDARWLSGLKLAVVGPGTGAALRARGLAAELTPSEHRGEALAAAIQGALAPGARILIARALEGREALPLALMRAGFMVDVVPAYRTVAVPPDALAHLRSALESGTLDVVTFASAAAARSTVAALGGVELLRKVKLACLGPVTAEGVAALGLDPGLVPAGARFAELVEVLIAHFAARPSR